MMLYDESYARRYRSHDDELGASVPYRRFVEWLHAVCGSFQPPIDVLDLGCGTGRYFWALSGVRELVGLDASPAMLAEARHPFNEDRIGAMSLTLIDGDIREQAFEPRRFDLVYSIGVLAEHVPLDARLVSRVASWLKPGGKFAFTTVHPASASVPKTFMRRAAQAMRPALPAWLRKPLTDRLLSGGMYADEARVRELLAPAFGIESLDLFESEAHLHCLCVATKQ